MTSKSDSGQIESQKFFAGVPESEPPGRHSTTDDSVEPPGLPARRAMTAAELRLRAWTELPERHRDEVCRLIRKRCEGFIASRRVERTARQAEADGLVSEVVAHLLRATSLGRDEPPMNDGSPNTAASADSTAGMSAPWPWLAKGRIALNRCVKPIRPSASGIENVFLLARSCIVINTIPLPAPETTTSSAMFNSRPRETARC